MTYGQFLRDAKIISRAFVNLGIRKGDIIAIDMPNTYQALVTFFACNRIGAVATFLNYYSTKEDKCNYLNLFHSPLIVNYDRDEEHNAYLKEFASVSHIITLAKERINDLDLNDSVENDTLISFHSLNSIAESGKKSIQFPCNGKDSALILFTSGTTGNPKSVVLTNENIIASLIYAKNTGDWKSVKAEKLLVCVPFSYPYGLVTSAFSALFSLREGILAPDISEENIAYYYNQKPNMIFGSPAFLDLTIRNIPEEQDLSSVNFFVSGGDFLTPAHAKRGIEFFRAHGATNVVVGNGFGNAELVSIGSTPVGSPVRLETAGRLLVGTTAMVIDPETKEEKGYGEEGILCVSGKHVFKEYYGEPELTNEVLFSKNGTVFFNTGTYAIIDEDGYLTITSRLSRFYIMSTLNKVYCDNVQNELCKIDCIYDAAVVKVPDDHLLFVNKAYIVLDDNVEIDGNAISYIQSKLPFTNLKAYEYPTYYELISELPRKQGTEKVDYLLLEMMAHGAN